MQFTSEKCIRIVVSFIIFYFWIFVCWIADNCAVICFITRVIKLKYLIFSSENRTHTSRVYNKTLSHCATMNPRRRSTSVPTVNVTIVSSISIVKWIRSHEVFNIFDFDGKCGTGVSYCGTECLNTRFSNSAYLICIIMPSIQCETKKNMLYNII